MTKELAQYRQLERRLWMTRWQHEGQASAEEDAILDEMEHAWGKLTEDEQGRLRLEGPRCWPMESSFLPPELADSFSAVSPMPWSYEGFDSPAQTILSSDAA